jgi:hypothetical protein
LERLRSVRRREKLVDCEGKIRSWTVGCGILVVVEKMGWSQGRERLLKLRFPLYSVT